METKRYIEVRLQLAFSPTILKIQDDSEKHRHHAEAKKSGGGHYTVVVVSRTFTNKTKLERHRMIYDALEKVMESEVHALAIRAFTPEEWQAVPRN